MNKAIEVTHVWKFMSTICMRIMYLKMNQLLQVYMAFYHAVYYFYRMYKMGALWEISLLTNFMVDAGITN